MRYIFNHCTNQKGQALITIFIIVSIVSLSLINLHALLTSLEKTNVTNSNSEILLTYAEGGIEEGLYRLTKNPSFTSENYVIDSVSVSVSVTGSNPYTLNTSATINNQIKKIQAVVNLADPVNINSWSEVP